MNNPDPGLFAVIYQTWRQNLHQFKQGGQLGCASLPRESVATPELAAQEGWLGMSGCSAMMIWEATQEGFVSFIKTHPGPSLQLGWVRVELPNQGLQQPNKPHWAGHFILRSTETILTSGIRSHNKSPKQTWWFTNISSVSLGGTCPLRCPSRPIFRQSGFLNFLEYIFCNFGTFLLLP